jgi:hypothetical protein
VTELGDLLELLHGADAPFTTLHGRFRIWRHNERHREAFLANARRRGGISSGFGSGEAPEETEEFLSLWREIPDRARMEREGSYGVRIGERWWLWQERMGAISNADDHSVGSGVGEELTSLLSPALLLGLLRFEPDGRGERAGRRVIVVNALPRGTALHGSDFPLHDLGLGADRYHLEIDAERGLVLCVQAVTAGQPFSVVETLEIAIDEQLDPSLFEFKPPEGEEVRSPFDPGNRMRNVSIVEAQAAAPFTVMIPERVPSTWRIRCHYVGESERPPRRPSVHLHYHSDSGHEDLNISQGYVADLGPEIAEEEFEAARAGEQTVHVRRRDNRWPQAQLYVEHDGTRIQMTSSSLTTDQLIALAAMLVPAPDAPSEL